MKIISPIVLLIASLLPFTATADLMIDKSLNKTIETMTVTYRTPIDYALYQYTTEMLVRFRLQLQADIYHQARTSLIEMASATPYLPEINPAIKGELNRTE
ncbi:MAG: hypothetical protein ACI8SK_000670 [Shewanella sp.]|jgi:hypothetical protein